VPQVSFEISCNGQLSCRDFANRVALCKPERLPDWEHEALGESTAIDYEDEKGRSRHEVAKGRDRPKTEVKG
jgi:hypothetical protein